METLNWWQIPCTVWLLQNENQGLCAHCTYSLQSICEPIFHFS